MAGNQRRKSVVDSVKGKSLVTPLGTSKWTVINEPRYDYNPKGQYEASICMDPEDENVAKFIVVMEKLRDAAVKAAKEEMTAPKFAKLTVRDILREEEDKEGNLTGLVQLKTKAYAVDFDGNEQTIPVFNAKGIEMEGFKKNIGNGSKLKLQLWASPYHMASDNSIGISFKLKKVQLIEHVEYGGGDEGFGDESGSGFEDTAEAVSVDEDF